MPTITPLQPLFAARISGLDLTQDLDDATFATVRDAFERYSVLVFPGQTITDGQQVRFSERFGQLEATRAGANGAGSKLIVPVFNDGALLSAADGHALQGEGEICGTAIECPMEMTLRVELIKGAHLEAPEILTTDTFPAPEGYRIFTGIGPDLMEAARAATRRCIAPLARAQGITELEAHALTTIGTAKLQREPDAMSYLERGLEIALAANSPEAATILINLAVGAFFGGDVRREDELFGEAYLMAERFGDLDTLRFSRGDRIWTRWALGHWDEAGRAADEFIAECAASPHYLEASAREIRAYLRLARGDRDGALDDYRRSLELARQIKDLQTLLPGLVQSARGLALLGKIDEAQALAREAIELVGEHVENGFIFWMLNPVARQLGLRQQVRDVVVRAPEGPWKEVALAGADGDFSRAADLFAARGAPTFEAEARLCAAEELFEVGQRAEGESELQKALAFYRKVGATSYIQLGEALLAASA